MEQVKKVWIDIENTPHVMFFNPIIKELEKKNVNILITARNYSHVYELLELFRLKYKKIGCHFGKNKIFKLLGLATRVYQLIVYIIKERPQLALTHGSRSQLLTSKILGIKCVSAFDYEYGRYSKFIQPTLTIVPQSAYKSFKKKKIKRITSFPGIKEDVYVQNYVPDNAVKDILGIKNDYITVTIRPPATEAHYHNKKSDEFFEAIIDFICKKKDICTIIIPRTQKQNTEIRNRWPKLIEKGHIIIPNRIVNGLDLIWFSDLVISGGGTMIREAAALNVPAYSFFQSKIGAVDKYLATKGKLTLIKNINDIYTKINLKRRHRPETLETNGSAALDCIIGTVDAIINR